MEENLRETLLGGQSFSWREKDGVFEAVLNDKVYRIKSLEEAYDDPFLYDYFDLGYDYEEAREQIRGKDETLRQAVDSTGLIRLLHQDVWVATVSFILSQNNNIKRITGLYQRLSERYGHEVGEGYFSFPGHEELSRATEEELRALGAGFRAPFIMDAVRKSHLLEDLDSLSFAQAEKRLEEIKGIGPKVASCVLIFSCRRREGFPMDVWMKRVMREFYPDKDPSYFHPYEALSQQYLFSWARNHFLSPGN